MINSQGDVFEQTKCSAQAALPKPSPSHFLLIITGKGGKKISGGNTNGLIALQLAGVELQTFVMISLHHVTHFYSFPPLPAARLDGGSVPGGKIGA